MVQYGPVCLCMVLYYPVWSWMILDGLGLYSMSPLWLLSSPYVLLSLWRQHILFDMESFAFMFVHDTRQRKESQVFKRSAIDGSFNLMSNDLMIIWTKSMKKSNNGQALTIVQIIWNSITKIIILSIYIPFIHLVRSFQNRNQILHFNQIFKQTPNF